MESRVNIYHVSDKGNGDFKDNGDTAQSECWPGVHEALDMIPTLNGKTLGVIFFL